MSKIEFIELLEINGYKPVIEDGIFMVITNKDEDYNKVREFAH